MKRFWNLLSILALFACLSFYATPVGFALDEDEEAVIESTNDEIEIELQEAKDEAVVVQKEMKEVQKEMKRVHKEMDKVRVELKKELPHIKHKLREAIVQLEDFDLDLDLDFDLDEIDFEYNTESKFGIQKDFKGKVESVTIDKRFQVKPETPLIIKSQFGSFQIEPGDAGEISMQLECSAGGETKALAKELLGKIKLTAEQTSKGVEVTVELDKKDEKEYKNSFFHTSGKITVPVNTPLSIDNQFGDLAIKEIKAKIECRNQFGATRIVDTANDLGVFAQFGPLNVSGHDGPAKIHCSFGELKVRSAFGYPLSVKASYGKSKVYLNNSTPNFEGSFSFGEGKIYIQKDFAGRIEAAASFGDVKVPDSLKKKKEMFSEKAEGELGDGKGKITASSSYAPLHILFNEERR
ncbi:MAG: hypothetical protein P9L94_00950 [Candidatus Hinthialibacter antarcticus]|nr:hypothetical protein [Candidatus Hinthialibacter antarcticus]